MFPPTLIVQLFSKNAKIEEKVKADDNRSLTTGLSGEVLTLSRSTDRGPPVNLFLVLFLKMGLGRHYRTTPATAQRGRGCTTTSFG